MLSPIPSCAACRGTDNLTICKQCRMVYYCNKAHRKKHWTVHHLDCGVIQENTIHVHRFGHDLRGLRPSNKWWNPRRHRWQVAQPHEGDWDEEAEKFVNIKYDLVASLANVATHASTKAALEHSLDVVHYHSTVTPGTEVDRNKYVAHLVPNLYLQLGRDQEAYDFIRQCGLAFPQPYRHLDWNSPSVAHDALESPRLISGPSMITEQHQREIDRPVPSYLAALVLMKLRIIKDLQVLADLTEQGGPAFRYLQRYPPEIAEMIRMEAMESDVARRLDIQRSLDLDALGEQLDAQCIEILQIRSNSMFCDHIDEQFWEAFVDPTDRRADFIDGWYEQAMFRACRHSWQSNPEARKLLHERLSRFAWFGWFDRW